jgi:type IV secretory pathway VirB6-like protein
MEHDEEHSWLRLLITVAIDWRLVIAVILLLLLLLRK